jgi:hypothetical protein
MTRAVPLVLVASLLASPVARADEQAASPPAETPAPRHVIEVGVAGLYERMTTSVANGAGTISSQRGGNGLALSVTYRSPFFLSPFLDVAYYPLYASARAVDLGTLGGRATATGSLAAVAFMAGPALDVFRFRLRAGVGTHDVIVRSTVLGQTTHAAESDMGYLLALDGYLLQTERLRIGLELRAAFIIEADVTTVGIGITMAGDALRF